MCVKAGVWYYGLYLTLEDTLDNSVFTGLLAHSF